MSSTFALSLIKSIYLFCRSLAVGTKLGYKLYSLNSVEKLEEIYDYGKSNLTLAGTHIFTEICLTQGSGFICVTFFSGRDS